MRALWATGYIHNRVYDCWFFFS
nr:FAD-binding domain-containing protein [Priestia endophytica]